ncbi:MAG: DUF2147 domain-containing protein [Pseudomonadota bacterium]
MKNIVTTLFAGGLLIATGSAAFADAIQGNWKTQSGETAAIAKCGSSFCITLKTGAHAGKRIGKMAGSNGTYSGNITDPADDREYSGSAKVSGSSMKLTGCALKVFCRTQTWKKL